MGGRGVLVWGWTLCLLTSWTYVGQALAGPQYMVTVPAVLEAGARTKFCTSLLQPNESLDVTVTLVTLEQKTELYKKTSSSAFHDCTDFEVPLVPGEKVYDVEVEVKGKTFHSKEIRKVMSKVYKPMTFIQMDKPLYLPGQTVHFRVVTLDPRMRPHQGLYDIIEIEDTHDNRVAQWLNQTSDGSILQRSYNLNPEAQEGFYQVIVTVEEDKIYQSFKVEKYVLPKYDVTIKAADEVNVQQEEVEVEICAKYTYGQPVPGAVKVEMCRPLNNYYGRVISFNPEEPEDLMKPPCQEETKEMSKTGCASFTIKTSAFKKLDQKILQDSFDVFAQVEEEGTGITRSQVHRMQISYVIGKLTFVDTPRNYLEGSDVEGKVKAVDYRDRPLADMDLYLHEGDSWSARRLLNLTTNAEGVATFSVATAEIQGDVKLHISDKPTLEYYGHRVPYYDVGRHVVSLTLPPSIDTKPISSLEVETKDAPLSCHTQTAISINYRVVGENQGSVTLMYLVLSRGAIVMHGSQQIPIEQHTSMKEGRVSFDLNVNPDIAPEVQVLAFAVLPSENVIAHSADFSTEKCFSHQVSLEFAPPGSVPGEQVVMKVSADPDSLCGVSAVDKSVLIKRPGKTLTADKIFDLLPLTKASYIPYEVVDSQECLQVRAKRYILPYPSNRDDAYTIFQNVGMKVATNLFVRMPSCLSFRGRQYHSGGGYVQYDGSPMVARMETRLVAMASPGVGAGRGGGASPAPIQTVRTFFPETWIWDLVEVGPSGTRDVSLTVPDTITTWETEAFCLSAQGFGLAPRKEMTVFQPFFLQLTMPYSIIRGEHFELKATVFNYLTSCIMVLVTPDPSSDFTLEPLSGDQYTSCLCGNERKTLSWNMLPSALGAVNVTVRAEAVESHLSCGNEIVSVPERGRIDVVTKPLIVKAEGVEVTKTFNLLLCPKGEALTEEVELQLPENVIVGSARASVSVLGDILGRALKNLDGLLRMPYGCGEQNMALLAPNIYILQYLKGTQQLTPAIQEKATNFLSSGYQRQLNYRHSDGAFSTFGSGPGNTWLTAFVVRSLAKAKSFVYIDPAVIHAAQDWMTGTQRDNGCFRQSGKLFNNRMKGGVSDEVTLTAYITASYLEMNDSTEAPVVQSSLRCLREAVGNYSNTYTTALLAYVFTLAGDMETRAVLLNHLHSVANKKGGFLHWSQKSSETSDSLSVEISSYVILAKLGAEPTAEDLGYTSGIVRWLTSQQNYYGGFSSTQDTVVALQALARYSALVFSPGGSSSVKVQSPGGQLMFDVNQDNKLLYQESALPDMTGKFSVEVKGSTCASTQLSLHYNIPTPSAASTLSIEAQLEGDCSTNRNTLVLQSRYSGNEETTNMVILDIKMLSGFSADPESVQRLRGSVLVDRVEDKEDHVLVYLRELPNDIAISHKLQINQEMPVKNLKAAVIQIYDYYQPSDKAETEYMSACPSA